MSNAFYNASGYPAQNSPGASLNARNEFANIGAAFDKFPALTASYLVRVNAAGTALESFVSPYLVAADLTGYETTAHAASTYQTQSGMSSYLTTASAASTYVAKAGDTMTGVLNGVGSLQVSNAFGVQTKLSTSAGYGGFQTNDQTGTRKLTMMSIGSTAGAAYGGAAGDAVLNLSGGNLILSTNDLARVTVGSTGVVGVGGAPTGNAQLESYSPSRTFGVGTGQLGAISTDTAGADLGGTVVFGGSYTGTSATTFAAIAGRKSNATAGNIAGYLAFGTNDASLGMVERMRIDAVGNINMGPAANVGSMGGGITVLQLIGTTSTRGGGIRLLSSNASLEMDIYVADGAGYVGPQTSHPLILQTNATERMRIDSGGYVGIACNAVSGVALRVQQPGNNDTGFELVRQTSSSIAIQTYNRVGGVYNKLNFFSSSYDFGIGGTAGAVVIDASGQVGIAANPQTGVLLTVAGAAANPTNSNLLLNGYNNAVAQLRIVINNPGAYMGIGHSGSDLIFGTTGSANGTSPTLMMKITQAGVISDSAGRELGLRTQVWNDQGSSSYSLALTDIGKTVAVNSVSITINSSGWAAGQRVQCVNYGSADTVFVQGSGMTLRFAGGTGFGGFNFLKYGTAEVLFVSSTTAIIRGNIT